MSHSPESSGNGRVSALEQRVNRLESALEAVKDTRQLEERLTDRVADRIRHSLPVPVRPSSGITVDARSPVPSPHRAAVSNMDSMQSASSWLLVDIVQDARSIARMFFDHRYRTSPWVGILTVTVLLALALTWWLRLPIWIVGDVFAFVIQIALLFVLFKVLTREARRYRSMIPR